MKTKKELSEMTREELGQELMRMPELEAPEQVIFKRYARHKHLSMYYGQ
jgi:hypothetical protein